MKTGEFAIINLLDDLCGRLVPEGDTAIDSKIEMNVEKWAYITTVMVERLADVANMRTDGLASVERVKRIAEKNIERLSDGYHTFHDLYKQRAYLFAAIVNQNRDKAWKTRKHEDGTPCFGGGWFLVTVETPEGAYGYHYEDKYWGLFKCEEIEHAKHWDGYTENDVDRLLSLGVERWTAIRM